MLSLYWAFLHITRKCHNKPTYYPHFQIRPYNKCTHTPPFNISCRAADADYHNNTNAVEYHPKHIVTHMYTYHTTTLVLPIPLVLYTGISKHNLTKQPPHTNVSVSRTWVAVKEMRRHWKPIWYLTTLLKM